MPRPLDRSYLSIYEVRNAETGLSRDLFEALTENASERSPRERLCSFPDLDRRSGRRHNSKIVPTPEFSERRRQI